jgi:hypothetical protein
MNLGLLFNMLGAAIYDGVPEDAKIVICEDDKSKGEVKAAWLYTNPNTGESEILLAAYPFKQMANLRHLWGAIEGLEDWEAALLTEN